MDMSVTVGWNTAQLRGHLPRGDGRMGASARTAARLRSIDAGGLRWRSSRSWCARPDGATPASRSTSIRGATPPSRGLPRFPLLHPEIAGLHHHRGQLLGPQRCRRRGCRCDFGSASPRAMAWGLSARSAPGRRRPRPVRHRSRPDPGHPEALDRSGDAKSDVDLFEINEAFASMPVAACRHPRHRPGDRERERERLQPRPSGRRPPAPGWSPPAVRAAAPGGGLGVACMCAGGGMGSAARHRGVLKSKSSSHDRGHHGEHERADRRETVRDRDQHLGVQA